MSEMYAYVCRGDEGDLARLIDRLIDGELSDAERRELLTRFESEPDGVGWRRCALAFLEAQCWTDAIGGADAADGEGPRVVAVAVAAGCGASKPVAGPSRSLPAPSPRRAAGLAASVGAAFLLGWLARGGGDDEGKPSVQGLPIASTSPVAPVGLDAGSGAVDDLGPIEVDDALGSELAGALWSNGASPVLSEDVLRDWERQGYRVDQWRRAVPVGLEDGRRVVVPVNEVRVQFVGGRTY